MSEIHSRPLQVLSIGAGAIGTYIGGSLLLNGHKVTFIERASAISELHSRGLRLNINSKDHHIPSIDVHESLDPLPDEYSFDFVIFALKSFDTSAGVATLSSRYRGEVPVLCLQNGVDNERVIANEIGAECVIPGTVTSAVGRRAIGDIILERDRGIGIADTHPLSSVLAEIFNQAGLNTRLFVNASGMKWSKMITNLIANASSAILDMTPAQIFNHPGLFRLEIAQLREALAVMKKHAIAVVDLPGVPVKALSFAVTKLPLRITRPILQRAVGGGRGGKMPSFHIDLHSGRGKSEVDYLNGAVVRYGAEVGINTPVNRVLNDTLMALTAGEEPLELYAHKPQALLSQINDYKIR